MAEISERTLYIYLKATLPNEQPSKVILYAREYGNLKEILACVNEGLNEDRLPPPA